MQNKIALEEHFAIEGLNYKNDVMDAPTFADASNSRYFRSFRPGFRPKPIPLSLYSMRSRQTTFCPKMSSPATPIVMRDLRPLHCKTPRPPQTSSSAA